MAPHEAQMASHNKGFCLIVHQVTAVRDEGLLAFGFRCDVSDNAQVEELASRVADEVGSVNIVFNNAGVRLVRPFFQHTPEQIERIVQVNLMGQVRIEPSWNRTER